MLISKYAVHNFFFYITGEIFKSFVPEFISEFDKFAESRKWTIDPPSLFLDNDEGNSDFVIGGELKIFDSWREKLDPEDEISNYNDVESIIGFLEEFSYRYSGEIYFEIEDVEVGSISNGAPCELLSETLLEEWRKKLGLKSE